MLLIHRPEYDDWTFPKGKLEAGETWEEAAVREVEEETGLRLEAGELAGSTFYNDRNGRSKEARYFVMSATEDARPQNEVDGVRWVPLQDAEVELTYDRDRELLRRWSEG